eukprot:TRINITY_DN3238_c0_g1_i1.p1 TRINITY_DN3238_c0_g1~~TRINITY_DN3238_c0_g1_i1.p1  ORF type:complete len:562 (-),score=135.86 TRINITY_DN3238_c0_g1_i1:94-1779(-)
MKNLKLILFFVFISTSFVYSRELNQHNCNNEDYDIPCLNILFTPFDHYGRYQTGLGIAIELAKRGHSITLMSSNMTEKWANKEKHIFEENEIKLSFIGSLEDFNMAYDKKEREEIGNRGAIENLRMIVDFFRDLEIYQTKSMMEYVKELEESFQEKFEKENDRSVSEHPIIDLLLCDQVATSCLNIALLYDIPCVMYTTIPISLDVHYSPNYIGSIGSGIGIHQSFPERIINFLLKVVMKNYIGPLFKTGGREFQKEIGVTRGFIDDTVPLLVAYPFGLDHAVSMPPFIFNVGPTRSFDNVDVSVIPEKIIDWIELDKDKEYDIMYISLGTSAVPDQQKLDFVTNVLGLLKSSSNQFFKEANLRIIWAYPAQTGDTLPELIPDLIDDQFFLYTDTWLPQTELFASGHLSYTWIHGGANSNVETASFSLPFVCTPLIIDQIDNCKRSEDLKIGVKLDFEKTSIDEARSKIKELKTNQIYKTNIKRIQKTLKLYQGEKRASDIVELISQTGSDYFIPHSFYLPWYIKYDLDILLVFSSISFFLLFIFYRIIKCFCYTKKSKID